jgi:Tol biopolymer transport system component
LTINHASKLLLTWLVIGFSQTQAASKAAGQRDDASSQEFAAGIVSTGHEFGISFTPDGKEAYFSRFAAKQPTHIFWSRLINGSWQQPEKLSISGDSWSDLDPFVSVDGQQLFFISTRPDSLQAIPAGKKDMDIWVATRNGADWGTPHRVENVNSEGKEGSPTVARDGTLYFFSDRNGGADKNAIYKSQLVYGHYQGPSLLPYAINRGPSDTSPFIAPDGRTLLFYSTREGGFGKADLYVSHERHGKWTASGNLGTAVNSADSEYNPVLSRDGRWLYFGRNGRLYVTPVRAIPALKRRHLW